MNKVALVVLLFFVTFNLFSQNNIFNLLDKEIIVHYSLAGQSFTLVQENHNYYVYRRIFGSGLPVIMTIVYDVIFDSQYKITFSKNVPLVRDNVYEHCRYEVFELFYGNGIELYLNGIRVSIAQIR
jgi:hypothetical protein